MRLFSTLFLALSVLVCSSSQAQNNKNKSTSETYPYRSELTIGTGLMARGWNYINITYGWLPKPQRTLFAQVEFSELKHLKERRRNYETLSLLNNSPKSFIYGKQNNFYVLRAGCGERRYFSDKQHSKTVATAFTYSGGIALGFIKPYYLDIIYRNDNGGWSVIPEPFTQDNQLKFLNPMDVDGASGFQHGWDDVSLNVGGYAKAGLLLDWGAWQPFVKSMELGVSLDFYFRKIPLMVAYKNTPVFVNLYANFYLGRRW